MVKELKEGEGGVWSVNLRTKGKRAGSSESREKESRMVRELRGGEKDGLRVEDRRAGWSKS